MNYGAHSKHAILKGYIGLFGVKFLSVIFCSTEDRSDTDKFTKHKKKIQTIPLTSLLRLQLFKQLDAKIELETKTRSVTLMLVNISSTHT